MKVETTPIPRRSLHLGHPGVLAVAGWALVWAGVTGLWGWRLWQEDRFIARLRQQGVVCYRQSVEVPMPEWLRDAEQSQGPTVGLIYGVLWLPLGPDRTVPAWSQLHGLISLESLQWFANPTEDDWRQLETLTSLRSLHLRSVTLPPGALARIARLPQLAELRLDTCRWPEGELAALATASEIRVLQLDFSPVEREELMSLAGLPGLRSLSLTGCGVSEDTTRDFLQRSPWIDLSDD
jgi:hypothetical protein